MVLDKKNYAILQMLDQDVRASLQQIGKKTRLNPETVGYRIKQLEKDVITGYFAYMDTGLKYAVYKIFIKNRSLSAANKQALVDFLLEQSIVSWFADAEGNYDYILTVFTDDENRFAHCMHQLLQKFGSHFQAKHILKSTHATVINEKYLYPDGALVYSKPMDFLAKARETDETDDLLIKELSLNSRVSYTELAKKAKLTPEAISYRVRRLEKNGHVIKYKVRIDAAQLGYAYYHVLLALQDQMKRDAIEQYYVAHPACTFVMHHIGYYDMHLELVVRPEDVVGVLDDLRAQFGDCLSSYELLLIRKEHTLHIIR